MDTLNTIMLIVIFLLLHSIFLDYEGSQITKCIESCKEEGAGIALFQTLRTEGCWCDDSVTPLHKHQKVTKTSAATIQTQTR